MGLLGSYDPRARRAPEELFLCSFSSHSSRSASCVQTLIAAESNSNQTQYSLVGTHVRVLYFRFARYSSKALALLPYGPILLWIYGPMTRIECTGICISKGQSRRFRYCLHTDLAKALLVVTLTRL